MILKVKTTDVIKKLEGCLILRDKKKSEYRIDSKDLSKAFVLIANAGISKVKVEIETKDYPKKEETPEKVEKVSLQMQYLEDILGAKVKKLEKHRDIKKFFEAINFNDMDSTIYAIYQNIIELPEIELANILYKANHKTSGIYTSIIKKVYDKELVDARKSMCSSIKSWLEENHPDYKQEIGRTISYSVFISFLLKHTGYKHY